MREPAQTDIARGVRTRLLPRHRARQARLAREMDHSGLGTLGEAQEDIFLSLLSASDLNGPFVGGGRGGEPPYLALEQEHR